MRLAITTLLAALVAAAGCNISPVPTPNNNGSGGFPGGQGLGADIFSGSEGSDNGQGTTGGAKGYDATAPTMGDMDGAWDPNAAADAASVAEDAIVGAMDTTLYEDSTTTDGVTTEEDVAPDCDSVDGDLDAPLAPDADETLSTL